MSGAVVAALIVPLCLGVLAWYLDRQASMRSCKVEFQMIVFRVSPWVYGLFAVCGGFSCVSIFWGIANESSNGAPEIMLGVGIIGLLYALGSLWWTAKSRIRLSDAELIVESPFTRKCVRLDQIINVRVAGGMIVIDEGTIPRLVIPLIYRKPGQLLANIEARRYNRPSSTDA